VLDIEINERKTKLASRLRPCREGGTKRRETVRNGMELAGIKAIRLAAMRSGIVPRSQARTRDAWL